ncbi:hypothetical protein [Streptomyces sp. DH10]|uniref:hypothetical protein n=1 Tax=Streptomyces sp. DH10 TaxID=3040121 RepID=UPI003014A539
MSSRVQPVQQSDPHRVGPYRVVGRIGSGGMGTVYAALSASGERMAVKVVHPTQAADDEFRARFRREVQLSQRVTGPCLIPVVDADPDAPPNPMHRHPPYVHLVERAGVEWLPLPYASCGAPVRWG